MAVLDLRLSVRQQAVAVLGLATVRAFVRERPYYHGMHVLLRQAVLSVDFLTLKKFIAR